MDRSVAQGRRTDPSHLAPAVVVGVLAFAAAWLALLPGVGFWDTAEFQAVGPLLGTAHPTGFPTYVLLGWLASVVLQPLGEPGLPDEPAVGDLRRRRGGVSPSTSSAS